MAEFKILGGSTQGEIDTRDDFFHLFKNSPIPENEILNNLGLYISRQNMSRLIFMNELYQKIINVHGVVAELGVRYGQNLALFESFRGMYEPFNYNRKILGFDTFQGFPSVNKGKDGNFLSKGDYAVPNNYEDYLEKILDYHESESPIAQKKKFELVKGDATKTLADYLQKHPETIFSLVYFDFDIYEPTKKCLEQIKNHVTKGTVLAFDELNCPDFPGETVALKEVFPLDRYAIQRSPLNPLVSYLVID